MSAESCSSEETVDQNTIGSLTWSPDLTQEQITYLKWLQSPLVEVVVGSSEDVFRLPSDFLARRSIPFRVMIEGPFEEARTRRIYLPETDSIPFQHITFWLVSPCPQIADTLLALVLVDIAIFATMYIVPALLNQALDALRAKIHLKLLDPEILDRIYAHTDVDSLLRSMIRVLFGTKAFSGDYWSSYPLKHWENTLKAHSELGWDFFFACHNAPKPIELAQGGCCRFHVHSPLKDPSPALQNDKFCERLAPECFEEVQSVEMDDEKGSSVDVADQEE